MPAYQPKTAKAPAQTPAATRAGPLLTSGLSRNPHLAALAQLQAQLASSPTVQRLQALQRAAGGGSAGLPGNLQAGIEHLSGLSLDGVRVHRNSDAPAKVGALAYAQGRDIHLGPGQERHLPHEAWHVVQQAQGRVRPTLQAKGAAINDDPGLEAEADVMGDAASGAGARIAEGASLQPRASVENCSLDHHAALQRTVDSDMVQGEEDINAAQDYAGNVRRGIDGYMEKIYGANRPGNGLENITEAMAKGFAAWAHNFLNKSSAYLFEAETASLVTDIRGGTNRFAILGVDTDKNPDLDIVTVHSSRDRLGRISEMWNRGAVEFKASTSDVYSSVDKLVLEGMWQLWKRQDTGLYDYLKLEIDNAQSHWPITERNFLSDYAGDYGSIPAVD